MAVMVAVMTVMVIVMAMGVMVVVMAMLGGCGECNDMGLC